jgi:hypothetical protein
MTPLIRRLQETFPDLPFSQAEQTSFKWTFKDSIKNLGPDFYRKIIPQHLVLSLEYSLLGRQLRAQFLSEQPINQKEIIDQLIAAIMMAELLEHVYQYYLIVPREVSRLRQQQDLYRELLAEILQATPSVPKRTIITPSSLTQDIRNTTINVNLYRLLFIRSKRALDLIAILDTGSETYRNFVKIMDKYTDPFLVHLAWLFFIPRLSVNLFLLIKHTVPGPWMGEEEKSLGWNVRFNAQMQRRWFELGNDIAWISVGVINCFFLTGALAPVGAYLSLVCFAYDVVLSAIRAYIELGRLHELRRQYQEMQSTVTGVEEQKELAEHIAAIENQINFETLRLGSHLTTTTTIFLAMCCLAPLFSFNPVIPVIGAIVLVAICFVNIALARIINDSRPRDTIEIPTGGVTKLGFFARKEVVKETMPEELHTSEFNEALSC